MRSEPALIVDESTVVLAIETSCDETAAALLMGPGDVLSSVVASQVDLHADYGGVVPEIASRAHLEHLNPVIARAVILSQTDVIEPDVLALDMNSADMNGDALSYLRLPYHESMEAHSRYVITQALRDADGNQTKAAERLKLQRTYLARLLRQQRQKLEDKDEADEQMIEQTAKS